MSELLRLRRVKLALLALSLLLIAVCAASGLTAVHMARQWYYNPEVGDFYESREAQAITWQRALDTAHLWNQTGGEPGQPLFRAYTTNFAYEMLDPQDRSLVLDSNLLDSLGYREMGEFEFEGVWMRSYVQSPLNVQDEYWEAAQRFDALYPHRWTVLVVLGAGFVLLVVALFLLCVAAGRRHGTEGVVLGPQDKIPLDLWLCAAAVAVVLLVAFADAGLHSLSFELPGYVLAGVLLFGCGCVGVATLYTVAARCKAGGWWKNTLLHRVLHPPAAMLTQLLRSLPLIWQAVLACLAAELASFLLVILTVESRSDGALMLYCLLHAALFLAVGLLALGIQRLKAMGERIAAGEAVTPPDLRWMPQSFRAHAAVLERIGEGMTDAAEQRIRSERLRTELITNVSHDLKTPLTSIVNYVDLLGRLELGGEAEDYVEVLDRQAARLKKLTDDLIEASKATSGSLEVRLERTGLCELLRQAAAEYADRLGVRELEAVMALPEQEVFALADGRHLWRVMDNLLSNACKYALPGTRVYIALDGRGDICAVAVKNISREPLNIDPDELMERFVRGDGARASEGSGLGLHIARSLMELQGGALELFIDGDLFKAQLCLPAAPAPLEEDAQDPEFE